ncbi:MAG: peptidylprolyl isomerase [Candidatus Nomurabacteria bacterium]|jgi:hypothetical protein|nr:peptidylprolyl isomerase [Candidatus Nomurabacteria bacterium]
MKPQLNKVISKIKKDPGEDKPHGPITQSNIEEHREKALESGRKFKYPLQVTKHRILVNAAIVSVLALVAFLVASWWLLYRAQDTGDFYYTATRVVPIPVADVDGEAVRYGDYMRRVRASIYYLEKQDNRDFSTEDGLRELNHTRRFNLDASEKVAFASKIARDENLTVTSDEVDENIRATLESETGGVISDKAYENALRRYYGWSMDDYRHIVRDRLLLRKAQFAVDTSALARANNLKTQVGSADFAELARANSDDEATKTNGGDVGTINISNNDPNGLIKIARQMDVGQVSDLIHGIDAYYLIKLTEKTDATVRYAMIRVNLTEFDKLFENLRASGKITEYIEIKEE